MDNESLKKAIAKNIAWYRKQNKLTQAELAAKINYSDKSISKWERAEGLPDICVLSAMAELFGVTVDDLLRGENEPKPMKGYPNTQRILIPMMAMGLVWLLAAILFFSATVFLPELERAWLIIIYAVPLSCIVSMVFAELWWPIIPRILSTSALIWSLSVCCFLTFPMQRMATIFIIAGILQILTLLWYTNIAGKRKRSK
jgi:transcriptional regulator with XRE-family HTH domain